MNVIELKQLIKETVAEIKDKKTQLSQDHSTFPDAWLLQSKLCTQKRQIRAYYYLYAFFRGRSVEVVESGRKVNEPYYLTYFAMQKLPEEARPLFTEWLKPVV